MKRRIRREKRRSAGQTGEKRSGICWWTFRPNYALAGAGYARWATLFNLKQMAQTVAYLQDHELLDYAVLSERKASAHFNELSARIKAAETRAWPRLRCCGSILSNYAKTRDTYVAYRKAGYSKRNFLQSMKARSRSTKAAKNYFDGLGFSCPPSRR